MTIVLLVSGLVDTTMKLAGSAGASSLLGPIPAGLFRRINPNHRLLITAPGAGKLANIARSRSRVIGIDR